MRTNTRLSRKIFFTILSSIVLALTSLTFFHLKAQAQERGYNIEVSPGKVNLKINPGDEYIQTFRVGNYSGEKRVLYIYIQDFTVIDEKGTPKFFENENSASEEQRRFALKQWVKLPTDKIELDNKAVAEIQATIRVPKDAEAGGHYGAFFVQTESPAQQGTAVGSVGRIASPMLVNVPGDVYENVDITQAFTDKQFYWNENPEVEFITYLKNTGNVHAIPFGALSITGGYQFKTKSVIYNQDQGAVLPGAPERKISEKFKIEKKDGLVPPIGKFNIQLVARYGTDNLPLETTIFFWILPLKFIAIVALTAILVIFVIWRTLVSFKKR